jgi:membrane-associated protein
MQIIQNLLHVDQFVAQLIAENHHSIYLVLFLIIFAETGVVVLPFLPGDSLLFTVGAFAAVESSKLDITGLFFLLCGAAFLGNWLNYTFGKLFGNFIKTKLNKRHICYLKDAQNFYHKYGTRAILLGRFIPIARTFVPFVAGIANMHQIKFIIINLISAILWVGTILFAGYFLSSFAWVQANFSLLLYGIILISLIPILLPKLQK